MTQTREAGVYRLHCPATGHNYIGATTDLDRRRLNHFRQLRRGWHNTVKLREVAERYGADGFAWDVLDSFPLMFDGGWAARMLCLGERHWHHHYLSLAPDLLASASNIGFNLVVAVPCIIPLEAARPIVWAWEDKYGPLYSGSSPTIDPSRIAYRRLLDRALKSA